MYNEQRDIDQLADRLDAWLPPDSDEVPNSKVDDPLMRAALALARAPRPEPSLDAMARMQARMLAANNKQGGRSRIIRLVQPLLTAAASVILVLFFISPVIADSVPGDPLYGVKRSWEQVELSTANLFSDEATVRLEHASQRAEEAVKLIERGEFDQSLIDESLVQVDAAAQTIVANIATPSQRVIGQAVEVNALLDYVVNTAIDESLAAPESIAAAQNSLETARENQFALLLPPNRPQAQPSVMTDPVSPTEQPARATATAPVVFATSTPAPTEAPPDRASATPIATATIPPTMTGTAPTTQTAQPTSTASEPPVLAYVSANDVANIREGPGTSFPVIAAAEPNTPVQVVGQNDAGDWFNITLPDGSNGWIAGFLVQTGTPPPPTIAPAGGDPGAGDDPGNGGPPDDPGNGDNNGNPPDNPGDFGCDQPGNACNAPGQQNPPGNSGNPGNPPGGGPPDNPGPPGGQP